MVYTLTLNPALDHVVMVDKLELGETNRAIISNFYPGGKGLNVSRILNELGVENKALGYLAGFSGEEIERLSREKNVNMDFIKLSHGHNRINIKLKAEVETEINGPGPLIDKEDVKKLYDKLNDLVDGDYLILAGSIPKSLDDDFYREIMVHLKDKRVEIVVDATNKALRNTLDLKPLLIKPNLRELEEIVGFEFKGIEDVKDHGRDLLNLGARNIIVSLGDKGALLIEEGGGTSYLPAPKGKLVNSVGSGDSMVAGFCAGLVKGLSKKEAFRLSIACGSATAFSSDLATRDGIYELLEKINLNN